MKTILITILMLYCSQTYAKTFEFLNGMQLTVSGYVGWRQIISDVKFDQVESEPELGIISSLKFTDRLRIFNHFVYGTTADEVLVYNNISYDLPIPVDNLVVTVKGGRLLHETFLYSTTRVNPKTRRGVFQPQSTSWDSLNRATVSGDGIGADIQYKNLRVSYVIDKFHTISPNDEAQGWANSSIATNLQTKPFGTQILSATYTIPEYGIRSIFWAEKTHFTLDYPGTSNIRIDSEHLGAGIEWIHDRWLVSGETFATKRPDVGWGKWKDIFFAVSGTVEYEVNDNWTVAVNYNQYRTPSDALAPPVARYYKDANIGVNWHKDNLMIGAQVNYIQGGRLVKPSNVFDNPDHYDSYFVTGLNVVYFFD